MSFRRQLFRGAATLGAGQAAGQLLSFARKVVLARLLTQADFGIAATFALTFTMVEMASNLAADKLLIQSKSGDEERLQGVVHAFEVARGLLLGLILLAIAWPVARLFGVPEATWAFQVLALGPVIKGFRHLDVARIQRGMRFGPQMTMELTTSVVALAAVWPLVAWLGDYSAVLWILLLREAMLTGTSHFMAERPYRWAWDTTHVRATLAFGWPLMINGVLMYAAVKGDRVIVGAAYSMEELGLFAAAALLAFTPVALLSRLHNQIALPALSRVQDNRAVFVRRYRASARLMAIIGGGVVIACALFGEELMTLFYGSRYAGGGAVLAWLGVATGIRLARGAPSTAAMALGDTKNMMVANGSRLAGVAAALGAAMTGQPLWVIAAAGAMGEFIALIVAVVRLNIRQNVPARIALIQAAVIIAIAAGGILMMSADAGMPARATAAAFGVVGLAAAAISVVGYSESISVIRSMISRQRKPVEFPGVQR